jgi:hypothetical protein
MYKPSKFNFAQMVKFISNNEPVTIIKRIPDIDWNWKYQVMFTNESLGEAAKLDRYYPESDFTSL